MQSTFALLESLNVGNLVSNDAAINTYFAEQFGRAVHLNRPRRSGGRSSPCRLLRSDDRICGHQLQG